MENKKTQSQNVSMNSPWIFLPKFQNSNLFSKTALKEFRTGLLLWIVFLLFLGLVQFSSPDLPDNDGYYHIKLAYLMRTEGIKPEFPWLPLSILNQRDYSDHHFLFHIALIPFTFGDLRTGAKIAAVFFASLAFLSTWYLLKEPEDRPHSTVGLGTNGCIRSLHLSNEHHPGPIALACCINAGVGLAAAKKIQTAGGSRVCLCLDVRCFPASWGLRYDYLRSAVDN